MSELCWMNARELAHEVACRNVSVAEVLEAHLRQIELINPRVNAVVTLVAEQALADASSADAALAAGEVGGAIFGLPIAVKDLQETKGIRTTYGSTVFRDHVPDFDALLVQRLRAAGAIVVGKTNTPEFGAGSQTFNAVFGATRNPWDLSKTCGGSSGGGAVAVACGMLPFADGSDLGGSLRNPASFCNIVGFRPSPGRVPSWPSSTPWCPFAVDGPMARCVDDVALLLSVLAGPDERCPLALETPGARFDVALHRDLAGTRIAFSEDLGGLPVDPEVRKVIARAPGVLEQIGCTVETASPDFAGADAAFNAWRAWMYEQAWGGLLEEHRSEFKDTVVWNVEQGQRLTGPELAAAERDRAALDRRVAEFMQQYDFLALPVSQVPPFDIEQPYPTEIDGTPMHTYIDWMRSCSWISALTLPAISVPCGFTDEGLPVGLQLVGRPRDDLGVLALAHAFEQATGLGARRPPTCEALILDQP
ncbi:MAG: amidase [Solirubrobacteraceae bacterium]